MTRYPSFLAVALCAGVACSDPVQPTTTIVSGQYGTLTFVTTDRFGHTINQAAGGTSLGLLLDANGTVEGQLFEPGDSIPFTSADHTFGDGTRVRVVLGKGSGFKIR